MIELRQYQSEFVRKIEAAWASGARNVLGVAPCGSGKTVAFSKLLTECQGPSMAIAHRQELLGQMSVALARNGVVHAILAPADVRRGIEAAHMVEFGRRWIDQTSRCVVAGVDTLIRRPPAWIEHVRLWITDEAHHAVLGNKWGTAISKMPNARGLGVTATPVRSDGKGLGRHADGVFDAMVVGPGVRDLINLGNLVNYRIFAPPNALDMTPVKVGPSGEYVDTQVREAISKAKITGCVVDHYKRVANGRSGVTFAVGVEEAIATCEAFRAAGVSAEVVTAKTPDELRARIIKRFREGLIQQLVNVDLFGEGFDLPSVEVVSLARPTMSYGLYIQQIGRVMRPSEGKQYGIILDHVGNCLRHGFPDAPREWSLDRRDSKPRGARDALLLTSCTSCFRPYERYRPACPYCGHRPVPRGRAGPEQVEGDLLELDAGVLADLRHEIARVDGPALLPQGVGPEVVSAIRRRHHERQLAQRDLRAAIALWAGYQRAQGLTDAEGYRLFYQQWGIDVGTAQTLGARKANELRERLEAYAPWYPRPGGPPCSSTSAIPIAY